MPHPPDCAHAGPEARPPCVMKPDVVFYDEMIPDSAQLGTMRLLQGADLILVAGTSCETYPAGDLPLQVRRQGGKVIELNLEPAPRLRADLVLQGPFSRTATALHDAWRSLHA